MRFNVIPTPYFENLLKSQNNKIIGLSVSC